MYFDPGYAFFEHKLARWMARRPDVEVVVVVGSRAIVDPPADRWADLDLVLFVHDPGAFLDDTDWPRALGEVWSSLTHRTFAGDPEWIVWFAPGLKVDLTVAAASGSIEDILHHSPYADIFRRGHRLLGRPQGEESAALSPAARPAEGPKTQADLVLLCKEFLHLAGKTALLLGRGDLWRAKLICDGELKLRLAALIAWHASEKGGETEAWASERDLESWADPAVLAALPDSFSLYDRKDVWRALFATLDIYTQLRDDLAARNDWVGVANGEQALLGWLAALRE